MKEGQQCTKKSLNVFAGSHLDEGNAVIETLLDEERLLAILLDLLALVGSDSLSFLV